MRSHLECIGSQPAELVDKAQEKIDTSIELHRPYVDDVHLTCPECGKTMTRIPEVMDCWFDSGSMPFAQQHYPFENKEEFEELLPCRLHLRGHRPDERLVLLTACDLYIYHGKGALQECSRKRPYP